MARKDLAATVAAKINKNEKLTRREFMVTKMMCASALRGEFDRWADLNLTDVLRHCHAWDALFDAFCCVESRTQSFCVPSDVRERIRKLGQTVMNLADTMRAYDAFEGLSRTSRTTEEILRELDRIRRGDYEVQRG